MRNTSWSPGTCKLTSIGLFFGALAAFMQPPAAAGEQGMMTPAAPAGGPSSAFTYQGFLSDVNVPGSGQYDFEFKLFTDAAGTTQIGSTVQVDNAEVVNGVFTVLLDFGAGVFGGANPWLEIAVRPGASTDPVTVLSPRQEITPSPQSMSLPNVYSDPSMPFVGVGRNFRISGNEVFGVRYEGAAADYGGMYVETSHAEGWPFYGFATAGSFRAWTYYDGQTGDWHLYNSGIRLSVPNEGGLRIGPSADYSLVIQNTTGSDGVRINDTGDDGIQIGSDPDYPNYGLYAPSPGVTVYGLWPNTAEASGNYALFTVDNIEAGIVGANGFSVVAVVGEGDVIEPGDIVAPFGVAEPIPGAVSRLPAVRRAEGSSSSPIGVVRTRLEFRAAPGKEAEGERSLQAMPGPARSGDYVSLTVLGVADVRIDGSVSKGQRLTAAEAPGLARALRVVEVDGVPVSEGSPVVGVALADAVAGATIPVMVSLR